jgi:L-amino acid N-acyltransferase YncA
VIFQHTAATVAVRASDEGDVPPMARIYGYWVTYGLASFELEPPGDAEMAQRRAAVLAGGYPNLVAVDRRTGKAGVCLRVGLPHPSGLPLRRGEQCLCRA